jgi:hypothetical protein
MWPELASTLQPTLFCFIPAVFLLPKIQVSVSWSKILLFWAILWTFWRQEKMFVIKTCWHWVNTQTLWCFVSQMQESARSRRYFGQIYRGLLSERTHGAARQWAARRKWWLIQERTCNQRFDIGRHGERAERVQAFFKTAVYDFHT